MLHSSRPVRDQTGSAPSRSAHKKHIKHGRKGKLSFKIRIEVSEILNDRMIGLYVTKINGSYSKTVTAVTSEVNIALQADDEEAQKGPVRQSH